MYLCVRRLDLTLHTIFLLDFGAIRTVRSFFLSFIAIQNKTFSLNCTSGKLQEILNYEINILVNPQYIHQNNQLWVFYHDVGRCNMIPYFWVVRGCKQGQVPLSPLS
jgi:hypothetical protein